MDGKAGRRAARAVNMAAGLVYVAALLAGAASLRAPAPRAAADRDAAAGALVRVSTFLPR